MLTTVFRTDSFDGWRIKTNEISSNLGDVATISSGITNRDNVVQALNDLIAYIGTETLATTATTLRGGVNELKTGSITFDGAKTFSGAVVLQSTLGVTGATTLAGLSATTGSFSSTLSATGNLTINVNKFSVAGSTGNTLVGGTLGVTGASSFSTGSFSSTLGVAGDFAIATNKFNVAASTGNTLVAGTLGVTGASTFSSGSFSSTLGVTGNFAVNTNRFNVTASNGNTAIAGTLGVTGAASFSTISSSGAATLNSGSITGALTVGTTLGVTGATTLAGLSATTGSFSSTLGVAGTATLSGLSVFATSLNDNSTVLRVTNSNPAFASVPNRVTIDTAGNVVINGNLSVSGTTTIAGTVATNVDWSSITNKPSPAVQVSLSGAVSGSATATLSSLAAGTYTAAITTALGAGVVTLGTHTTGNYVSTTAAGTGISISGSGAGPFHGAVTITNNDRGSSQNIFKAIAVSGQSTINAASNSDTLTFAAGSNVSITTNVSTKTVTINATSTPPNDSTITLTAGAGMTGGGSFTTNQSSGSSITITNNDRGSSQNIFKNIAVPGQTTVVADSNDDTLTLVAGSNITITTNASTDTITINGVSAANNGTITVAAGSGLSGGGSFTTDQASNATVTLTNAGVTSNIAGTGISVSGATGEVTITNTDRGSSQNIFKTVSVNGSTNLVADSNDDVLTINTGTINSTPGIFLLGNSGSDTLTIHHYDTSELLGAQGGTGIASITVDTYGHVTAVSTASYLTSESDTLETVTQRGNYTWGDMTVNGLLAVESDLVVNGNLVVHGDQTIIHAEEINLADNNIVLNSNFTTGTPTENAGITIRRGSLASKVFEWDETTDLWSFGPETVEAATFMGSLNGVANSALKWQTSRSISITGDATWTVSMDGSGNATSALTLANSGASAGTYGSTTAVPIVTVDAKGRVTSISTASINNGSLTLAVSGNGLSGSASFTANQSGNSTFTVSSNATASNTASTVVFRDASGNFSAGTITATLNGSASSVAWTGVSGRPTAVSAFTNDSNYVASGSSPTFNAVTATSFNATSSLRYKTQIETISDASDKVKKLRGVIYDLKDGSRKNEIGLIAEEVQQILPSVVGLKDGQADSVDYGRLSAVLIEAVKDILARLEKLEARN